MFDSPTFTRMFALDATFNQSPNTNQGTSPNSTHNSNSGASSSSGSRGGSGYNTNNNNPSGRQKRSNNNNQSQTQTSRLPNRNILHNESLSGTQKYADLLSWQIVHTAEIEQTQRRTMTPDYKPVAPPLSCIFHRSFSESNLFDSFDDKENGPNVKTKQNIETLFSNELNRRHSAIADLAIEPCSLPFTMETQCSLDQIIAAPPPGFEDDNFYNTDKNYRNDNKKWPNFYPLQECDKIEKDNLYQIQRKHFPLNESSASSAASLLTGSLTGAAEDMSELSTGSLQLTSITQMSVSDLFGTSTNRTFSSDTTGNLTDSFKNYQSSSGALPFKQQPQSLFPQATLISNKLIPLKAPLTYTLDFDDDVYDEDFGDSDVKINQDTSTGPSFTTDLTDFDLDMPSPPAHIPSKPANSRFGVYSKFKRSSELSRDALFSSNSSSSSSSELSPGQIISAGNARRHKTSKSLPENLYKSIFDESKNKNKEGNLKGLDKKISEHHIVMPMHPLDQYYNCNGRLARTKSSTIRRKKKGKWENAREWNNSASFSQTKQCFCEFEAPSLDPNVERQKCSFCEPNNFGDVLTPCDMNMFSYSEPSTSALDLSTANTVIERKSFDETEEDDHDKMMMVSSKDDAEEEDDEVTPKNLQSNANNDNVRLDPFDQPIFPSETEKASHDEPEFPSPPPPLRLFTNNQLQPSAISQNFVSYNSPSSSFSSSLRSTDPYVKKECSTWSKREDIPLLQSVDESCTMTFSNVHNNDDLDKNSLNNKTDNNLPKPVKATPASINLKQNLAQDFNESDNDSDSKSSGSHSLDGEENHAQKDKSSTPDMDCEDELEEEIEDVIEHDDSTTSGSFLLDESGASATMDSFVLPDRDDDDEKLVSPADKPIIEDRLDKEDLMYDKNNQATPGNIVNECDQQTIKRKKPAQSNPIEMEIGKNDVQDKIRLNEKLMEKYKADMRSVDSHRNKTKLFSSQKSSERLIEGARQNSQSKNRISKNYDRFGGIDNIFKKDNERLSDNKNFDEEYNIDKNYKNIPNNNNMNVDAYEPCSQATERDLEQSEFSLIHQNSELEDDESLAFDHYIPGVQSNEQNNSQDYFSFSPIDQHKHFQEYHSSGEHRSNMADAYVSNIKTPDLFTALKYSSDEAREAGFLTLPSQSQFVITSSVDTAFGTSGKASSKPPTGSGIKESVLDRFDSKDFSSERDLSLEAVLQEESYALKERSLNKIGRIPGKQTTEFLATTTPAASTTTTVTPAMKQVIGSENVLFPEQNYSTYANYSETNPIDQETRNVKIPSKMTLANVLRISSNSSTENNNIKTGFNPDMAAAKCQFVSQTKFPPPTEAQGLSALNSDVTEVLIQVPIQKGKATKKLEFNQKLADVERLLITKQQNSDNKQAPLSTVTTLIGSNSAATTTTNNSSSNNIDNSINEKVDKKPTKLVHTKAKDYSDCRECNKSCSMSGSSSGSSKDDADDARDRCCDNADWSNSYSLSTTNSRGVEGSTYSTATCTITNLSGDPNQAHQSIDDCTNCDSHSRQNFRSNPGNQAPAGKREFFHDSSYQSRLELTSPACLFTNKRHIEHLKQMQGDNTSEDASEPNSQDTYDKCFSKCCQGKHHFQCNDCGQIASLAQGQYKQHRCFQDTDNSGKHSGMKNISAALKAKTLMFRKKDFPESIFKKSSTIEDVYFDDDHDENDVGVHAENYRDSLWIHIGNKDEMNVWKKRQNTVTLPRNLNRIGQNILDTNDSMNAPKAMDMSTNITKMSDFDESEESTVSERDFRSNYENVTHRLIHRKASIELYRRLLDKSFVIDKRLTLYRDNNEFGFRIHGSRPVVVSAIEKKTSAEYKGLSVGDILVTVNGVNVLDASHSEVVKLAARSSSKTLVLEVTSTAQLFGQNETKHEPKIIINGYLKRFVENLAESYGNNTDKMTNSALWRRRWFVLKSDACLYWYKTPKCIEPIGAISLQGYCASMVSECLFGQKHLFRLVGFGNRPVKYFAAIDHETALQWVKALASNSIRFNNSDHFMEQSLSFIHCKPIAFPIPVDCHGFLLKLNSNNKTWKRRFFVLKDACLYFYADMHSNTALGLFFLHGYKFNSITFGHNTAATTTTTVTTKDQIRHVFELIPPNNKYRRIVLATHSDCEKKRWLAALEYSIDRWIQLSN